MKLKKIVALGIFAAISIVGIMLIRFSVFPQVEFLEYDPADIPIFITTFAFGTLPGILLTIVVSVIQGFTVSAQSGIIGIIMHIVATGSFVICAGVIYNRKKTRARAYIALLLGTVTMTGVMVIWNLVMTPIYMGVPRAVIVGLLPYIIAFNLFKAGLNSILTAVLYKYVHREIDRFIA